MSRKLVPKKRTVKAWALKDALKENSKKQARGYFDCVFFLSKPKNDQGIYQQVEITYAAPTK